MKFEKLHHVLGLGKLNLQARERIDHQCYELYCDDNQVLLPNLITLPISDETKVSSALVTQCAESLGMTPQEFIWTVGCYVGKSVALLALAILCHEAKEKYCLNATYGWDDDESPLEEIIDCILRDSDPGSYFVLNAREEKVLKRLHTKLKVNLPLHQRIEQIIWKFLEQ